MIRPFRSLLGLGLALMAFAAPAAAQTLRIGTEAAYKPFAYVLPSGELTGFDIDITKALCKQMGVECTITNMAFDGLIPALNAKKVDAIIASMSITEEREKTIGMAGPYYFVPAMFIGAKDAGLEATPEALSGKYVGVQRGSTMSNYVKATFPDARVQAYDTVEAAVLDLGSGRVDLVFADSVVLSDFLAGKDGAGFAPVGDPVYNKEYLGSGAGIGVRLDDAELKAKFNDALAALIASGEYKTLNDKYVPIDILPK
ncbi:transporter substrate-binding domain-containing protein [Amaricoccus sp.]|uniref:transporter substrate-binding domain-containing protein n=1 Tax=Amaricoccus sp. TaxID=1872485 RepID=UPI002609E3A0|nr:transporter substrate-binding domain-containing protein [uncultured Amaricoccus sp.]